MLTNRTYNGLTDRMCRTVELKEEAVLQAGLSVKGRHRCNLMLGADRRVLVAAHKRSRESRTSEVLDVIRRDFYVVEKAMLSLENCDRYRLPVLMHGSRAGLPRAYDIAACLVGGRDGRIDEGALSRFLEAYQSVTPLTMAELRAIRDMLTAALIKLLSVECTNAMDNLRAEENAIAVVEQLSRQKLGIRRRAILERLNLRDDPILVERMYVLLSERNMAQAVEELTRELELEDQNKDQICTRVENERMRRITRTENAIHSLRNIAAMDWEEVFEQHCCVHRELCRDETYCRMDARSKGYYREWTERLAAKLGAAETIVARKAVQLSADRQGKEGEAGYYLFMDGREEIYAALRPDKGFKKPLEGRILRRFVTVEVLTVLLLIWLAATDGIAPLILSLIPAWSIGSMLCVKFFMAATPVRYIPRIKSSNLGPELTLIVIPALITDEKQLRAVIGQMEKHMLASRLDCCRYAVLGDFPDAERPRLKGENELIMLAKELTGRLNEKYPAAEPLFYYLHRHRELNGADGIYMGRERKRGAICDLVTLICDGRCEAFCCISSPLPENIRYCMTLDSDTILPPGAAAGLIGCMEHPLNRPEVAAGIVKEGYGLISPRMAASSRGAEKSEFARVMSGETGIDGYFPTAPEFYQDVFGCGLFGGKGIFDVQSFRSTVMQWIPENTVLSHDMLEGCFLHSGYAGDVTLFDSEPASFISWWKRQHRWIRGDWQLLPFLGDTVRDANGVTRENPLSMLSRRKILDNLRRSMLPWSVMYTALLIPYTGFGWYCLLALVALWGGFGLDIMALPCRMLTARNVDHMGMVKDMLRPVQRALLDVVTLPYGAKMCSSARNRSLYRVFVSHRYMLEWQTAAQTMTRPHGINGYYGALYFNPAMGIVMAAGAIIGSTPVLAATLAVLWIAMPLLIWALDTPYPGKRLPAEDGETLMNIARGTWAFFDSFCTEENNFLPPDNFQQYPYKRPALNTSPTNVGMGIMAAIAAYELGIISRERTVEHTGRVVDTIERMEKWHGHLYNWYRADTLEVLHPRYVSTVDSGNLAASLLTAAQAMEEAGEKGLSSRMFDLVREMDFTLLYDKTRKLFHIGYDEERCQLSSSWYDLMASEARLTSLVAIGMGQVEYTHWFSLSRLMVPVCGRSLVSWSGTMFEYLMPVIFTGVVPETLISESCESVVKAQRRYSGGQTWGISESGYYAFDRNMCYQYRAFGISCLSLTGERQERVISPYSTLLSLAIAPGPAMENIQQLNELGALGLYGMYEAIDYDRERLSKGESHAMVKSYMAHHQGMGICSIANLLCDGVLSRYFWRVPELGAIRILNEERMPPYGTYIRTLYSCEVKKDAEKKQRAVHRPRRSSGVLEVPEAQLLTNGSYTRFITDSGQGFSRRGNIMLTCWRKDHLRGSTGVHMLIGLDGVAFDAAEDAEAVFLSHKVEFTRRIGDFSSKLETCVSTGQDGEIYRLTLANHGEKEQNVDVCGAFEPCLCQWMEYISHPGFNRLTIDARLHDDMLIFEKRPKGGEQGRYLYVRLISPEKVVYQSDGMEARGRGKPLKQTVLQNVQQQERVSAPVMPFAAARTRLRMEPGESREIWLLMGYADSLQGAQEDCEEMEGDLGECFALAEMQASGMLNMAGLEPGKAELFERIAARVLLGMSQKEGRGKQGGLSALWKWGISGDRPVLLIRITRITELRILRALGEFSAYMEQRLCPVDVVAVGNYYAEYRNELRERMEAITGIRVVHGYDIGEGEYEAMRSVATLEINPELTLNRQFAAKPQKDVEYKTYDNDRHEPLEIQRPELDFFCGYGGFGKGGEYVISLESGQTTPMPWCNVIANDTFGTIVTERGGGHTWCGNSRENKLTPWYDDPVNDPQGEFLLLTDIESGETYSPFLGPLQKGRILVEHGYGYSHFTTGDAGLHTELTVFVHRRKPVKYSLVSLENPGSQRRSISVMYGVEWCLGDVARPEAVFTCRRDDFIFARNCRRDEDTHEAYIWASEPSEACSDRAAILRAGWDAEMLPEIHGQGRAMSALRTIVQIEPGEKKEILFCLGEDRYGEACDAVRVDAQEELKLVKELWQQRTGCIRIHTPDHAMDRLMNGRLLYQIWASRILGRCGYYQCGGAYGFRDQLQDMLPLLHHAPEMAKAHILLCASRQFKDGDVLHWWHSPCRGVRTYITDDRLFLPYVAAEYVETTGDRSILGHMVTYLAHRPIPPGARDLYMDMQDSREKESLYLHCVRAMDSIHTGRHGLPLMGGGDWNDGMDMVGENGGESVWLGWFLLEVLGRMERMAKILNKRADEKRFRARRERLKMDIEKAWDGAWYRRAYYGDGTPLGSGENSMCRIDCISQAWAAMCGGERAGEAMDSVLSMLYDEKEGVVMLLTPPFEPGEKSPGYIQAYIPGVRENGGQYTHGAVWAIKGLCSIGWGEKALALFDALNPINHGLTRAQAARYKAEPYVVAGDVYSEENRGRGGWTWYTGAAGWMYKVCLEDMLGIRRRGNVLEIAPAVPFESYTVEYQFGGSNYVLQLSGKSRGRVELVDDGLTHEINMLFDRD